MSMVPFLGPATLEFMNVLSQFLAGFGLAVRFGTVVVACNGADAYLKNVTFVSRTILAHFRRLLGVLSIVSSFLKLYYSILCLIFTQQYFGCIVHCI